MEKIRFFWEQIRVEALRMPTPLVLAGEIKDFSWQKYKINITAMVIYGLVTAIITMFYEMGISSVEFYQWFWSRAIYLSIRALGAVILGQIVDYLREKIDNEKNCLKILNFFQFFKKPKIIHYFLKGFSDGLALSLFQIPIYIFAAFVVGVGWQAIIINSLLYIVDNFALGWLFGFILDKTRQYFSRKSNGVREI